jgi:hypothetical protein
MRPTLLATVLLLACSQSPDGVAPFPFGRAHADCGPADGPAVRIQLGANPLSPDVAVPAARPHLELLLNAALTEAGGKSFLIYPEGRGRNATAHAVFCAESGDCAPAASGRIRLDPVTNSPSEISGTFDLMFPDQTRLSGRFTAAWIAFSPMCG